MGSNTQGRAGAGGVGCGGGCGGIGFSGDVGEIGIEGYRWELVGL